MLGKVDTSSTFCNKFHFCCWYYHWSYNLCRNKFELTLMIDRREARQIKKNMADGEDESEF